MHSVWESHAHADCNILATSFFFPLPLSNQCFNVSLTPFKMVTFFFQLLFPALLQHGGLY